MPRRKGVKPHKKKNSNQDPKKICGWCRHLLSPSELEGNYCSDCGSQEAIFQFRSIRLFYEKE